MPDEKSIQKLEITIDKSIVHNETENNLITRVPGTYGDDIRYLFLNKSDVEKINNGKTFLYSLDPNAEYLLYDDKNNVAERIQGIDLYNRSYDPSVYKMNKAKEKNSENAVFESDKQASNEKSTFQTPSDDISDKLNNILTENTKAENTNISIPAIASIAEHYEKKIFSLEDDNLRLSEKINKSQAKIEKAQHFINVSSMKK